MTDMKGQLAATRSNFYDMCRKRKELQLFTYNLKNKNCLLRKAGYAVASVTWIILAKVKPREYKIQLKFEKQGQAAAQEALSQLAPLTAGSPYRLTLKDAGSKEPIKDGYLEYFGKQIGTFSLEDPKTWKEAIDDLADAFTFLNAMAQKTL